MGRKKVFHALAALAFHPHLGPAVGRNARNNAGWRVATTGAAEISRWTNERDKLPSKCRYTTTAGCHSMDSPHQRVQAKPQTLYLKFGVVLAFTTTTLLQAQVLPSTPFQGRAAQDFARLFPSRVKSFVKASYDPDDRVVAAQRGNDDGFTGTNFCEAYRTSDQGAPLSVLAHFEGRPGVLGLFFRNFWSDGMGLASMPGENNQTKVWLDGLLAYDQPLQNFFRNQDDPRGQIPPFSGEFTGHRSGGHLTHAQLRWNNSFKLGILDDGYQNAARFHRVAALIATPEGELPMADMADWQRIAAHRGTWPHQSDRSPQSVSYMLAAGAQQTLQLAGPSTLLEVTCTVGAPMDWLGLWARFSWDNQTSPSVDLPLRLLGGRITPPFSHPVNGLLFNNDGDRRITCYFPMPFASTARLTFVNQNGTPVNLRVDYAQQAGATPQPWGYFTAVHRAGVTGSGEPFLGPRITNARGTLRGLLLEDCADTTGRIPNQTLTHLEGDLCLRINGTRGEDHSFDASETSIGRWGWYLTPADRPFTSDSSFQTSIKLREMSPGQYEGRRMMGSLLIFDPVHFVNGIDMVLEHGVQNQANAEYAFTAFLFVEPGSARRLIREIDIGDPVSESASNVQYTQWSLTTRTSNFFRDQFYGSGPVTDSVRHIRDFLRFRVVRPSDSIRTEPVCVGFRLDRMGGSTAGICQATVLVDGQPAGLLHSFTHSSQFPWKEGNECEVELPRALTDGRNSFTVELRPRLGTDPLKVARAWIYEYTK